MPLVLLYPKLACYVQVFRVDGLGQKVFFSSFMMYLLQSMVKISCAIGKTVLSRN